MISIMTTGGSVTMGATDEDSYLTTRILSSTCQYNNTSERQRTMGKRHKATQDPTRWPNGARGRL